MSLHCGKCGYNVHGLPSNICPECGSDLDVVGKISDKHTLFDKALNIVLFAIWMPILAVIIITLLDMTVIPNIVKEHAHVHLEEPTSGVFSSVSLIFNSSTLYFPGTHPANQPWQTCSLQLEARKQTSSISIDLQTLTFSAADGTEKEVSESTLLNWLSDSGVKTASPRVSDEAQVILEIIQKANNPEWLFAKEGKTLHVTGGTISKPYPGRGTQAPLVEAGIDPSPFYFAKANYWNSLAGTPYVHKLLLFIFIVWYLRGIWIRWNKPIPLDTEEPSKH